MNVNQPMFITARLEAGLKIGNDTISVASLYGDEYSWRIETDGRTLDEGAQLRCPMARDYNEVMASLLGFLSAAAESYAYSLRNGSRGENEDLFSPEIVEWAYQNSDELTMLQMELEEAE